MSARFSRMIFTASAIGNIAPCAVWSTSTTSKHGATLDDASRRRLNHVGAIWTHWRRSKIDSDRSAPAVRDHVVKAKGMPSHPNGRPVFWPQQCVRAAHEAMLKSRSTDLLVLARLALEAAIPNQGVLIALLPPGQNGGQFISLRASCVSRLG
jgi:hypothetical protein